MISKVVNADIHAVCDLRVFPVLVLVGASSVWFCLFRRHRNDFTIGVHGDPIRCHLEICHASNAMGHSLLGLVKSLDPTTFAADLFEVLKVAFADGSHVVATEDADFKVMRFLQTILASNFCTGSLEIFQCLEDNAVGTDVLRNASRVTAMRNQFVGRGKINTVDVGISENRPSAIK